MNRTPLDMLRAELDAARESRDRMASILVGIHELLYPAPVDAGNGAQFVFRPGTGDETMQGLSDRIRAIPDEIAGRPGTVATIEDGPGIKRWAPIITGRQCAGFTEHPAGAHVLYDHHVVRMGAKDSEIAFLRARLDCCRGASAARQSTAAQLQQDLQLQLESLISIVKLQNAAREYVTFLFATGVYNADQESNAKARDEWLARLAQADTVEDRRQRDEAHERVAQLHAALSTLMQEVGGADAQGVPLREMFRDEWDSAQKALALTPFTLRADLARCHIHHDNIDPLAVRDLVYGDVIRAQGGDGEIREHFLYEPLTRRRRTSQSLARLFPRTDPAGTEAQGKSDV